MSTLPDNYVGPVENGPIRITSEGDFWLAVAPWRDAAGHEYEALAIGATSDDAQKLATVRLDVLLGTGREHPDTSLNQAAVEWLAALTREGRVRASTIEQYRRTWKGTLSPTFGDLDVNAIDQHRMAYLLTTLVRRNQDGSVRLDADGNPLPITGPHPRTVLSMLAKWTVDNGLRTNGVNVIAAVKPPPRTKGAPRAMNSDEWEEVQRLTAADQDLADLLLFLRWTSARIGEGLALRWEDLSLDAAPPAVVLRATLGDSGKGATTRRTDRKTGGEITMSLAPPVVQMLIRRRNRGHHTDPTDLVWCARRTGKSLWPANIRTQMRALLKGTSVEWVSPVTMRQTFLTEVSEHFSVRTATTLAGHTSEWLTAQHYIDPRQPQAIDAAAVYHQHPAPTPHTVPA